MEISRGEKLFILKKLNYFKDWKLKNSKLVKNYSKFSEEEGQFQQTLTYNSKASETFFHFLVLLDVFSE